jgi:hypothetical protein
MNKEKPIEFFFDFLNVVFFLLIFAFFFVYFIVGDRVAQAENIVKALMPFTAYSIIFLVKLRVSRRELKGFKKQNTENEIVLYLTKKDIRKDLAVVILLPIVIIALTIIDRYIDPIDVIQAILVFLVMFSWHWFKLRARAKDISSPGLRRGDLVRDEIVIFSLPFVVLLIPVLQFNVNLIDLLQAVLPLMIMYLWRKLMLSKL